MERPHPATAAAAGTYALVRIGALRLAVASHQVLRAVPPPAALQVLPRRQAAISGVFQLDGQVVPVVELGRWLGSGAAPDRRADDERILVLHEGSQAIGVRVDALIGVRRARAGELTRVHHGDDPEELFQSVLATGDGDAALVSVLEVSRLMLLAGVWCDEAGIARRRTADAADGMARREAATTGRVGFASFRVGDALIGIPAADIGECLPVPVFRQGLPSGNGARGLFDWRGRLVPAVDLTQALAAHGDATPPGWVCVVLRDGLTLGVLVDQVHDLLRVDTTGFAPASGIVLATTVVGPGRSVQLLDTARLFEQFPETHLSEPRGQAGAGSAGTPSFDESTYMVFEAGTAFASSIESVKEVIALPDAARSRLAAGRAATLEWRGQAVPVLDLRRIVGNDTDSALNQVVVLERDAQCVAVAIGGVRGLISAGVVRRSAIAIGGRTRFEMISVDSPGHRASYAVLDLVQCLREAEALAAMAEPGPAVPGHGTAAASMNVSASG